MEKKLVFTIGRQYGSGGREVGEKLAEQLGIRCYDKEILAKASQESGYCEEVFSNYDEQPVSALLFNVAIGNLNTFVGSQTPISMEAFLAQYHTIESLAEADSCVFIGRCSDYVLRERSDVINVFIMADDESRIERISARNGISKEQAESVMKRTDKNRASYYSYYTEQRWGDAKNYDLCLDSGKIGVDGCVEIILDFAKKLK